eukprot:153047-Chlamydomonas_euryale.AAC.3
MMHPRLRLSLPHAHMGSVPLERPLASMKRASTKRPVAAGARNMLVGARSTPVGQYQNGAAYAAAGRGRSALQARPDVNSRPFPVQLQAAAALCGGPVVEMLQACSPCRPPKLGSLANCRFTAGCSRFRPPTQCSPLSTPPAFARPRPSRPTQQSGTLKQRAVARRIAASWRGLMIATQEGGEGGGARRRTGQAGR